MILSKEGKADIYVTPESAKRYKDAGWTEAAVSADKAQEVKAAPTKKKFTSRKS